MKTIHKTLKRQKERTQGKIDKLQEKLEKRVDNYDEKNEAWQISEKGEAYVEVTENLENRVEDLESFLGLLEEAEEAAQELILT